MHRFRWLAGLPLSVGVLTTSGCGVYAGPSAVVPTNGDPVVYGASAGYRMYLTGTQGLVLGASGTLSPPEGQRREMRGWGKPIEIGYGYQPLPHLGHWGTELTFAAPVLGALPDAGGHAFAIGWSWQAAFPYRISGSKKPWELSEYVELFSTLTPSVELVQLVPLGAGHKHRVVNSAVFSLTYRLSDFVSTLP